MIGPMTVVGAHSPQERPEMVECTFPRHSVAIREVPFPSFTDRIVGVDDVWGDSGAQLRADLSDRDEAARVDHLEAVLLEQLERHRDRKVNLNTAGLASSVVRCGGQVSVERLAHAAGISRQRFGADISMSASVSRRKRFAVWCDSSRA